MQPSTAFALPGAARATLPLWRDPCGYNPGPMPSDRLLARRFLFLRLLRASLALGALYDLGFAAVMVLAPGLPERLFRLPLPGERFYLWILAVLLSMLAALYLFAAKDPRRYTAIVLVAACGRTAGGLAFLLATVGHPELAGLVPLAAADLAFGIAHAVFWWPTRL
jgi:hypothetical protein